MLQETIDTLYEKLNAEIYNSKYTRYFTLKCK